MTRAVFDAVGYIRGIINPYSRWGRILFDHSEDYDLIVSTPLVREFIGTTTPQRARRKFDDVEGRDLRAVLGLMERAIVVEVTDEL